MIYKCLTNWGDTAYNMLSEDNLNEIETLTRGKKAFNLRNVITKRRSAFKADHYTGCKTYGNVCY